jgi:hypothetical protein
VDYPHELPVCCDLSEMSLDTARVVIGAGSISDLAVYCGEYNATYARKLQAVHGFLLTVFPDCLLRTKTTWGVKYFGRVVWSRGVP